MVDYSRWDKIIEEEEKAEQSKKLTQDLIKIQQEKPEAIQKMKEELEAMKINALKVKNNQKQSGNAGDMKKTFNSQADVMRSELERLKKEQEKMDAKQKELEQLASAGDGASILKFFEAQGLSREDMQRMLGGNNDDSKSVIEKAQKANVKLDPEKEKQIEQSLQIAEEVSAIVTGDDKLVKQKAEEADEKRKAKEKEEQDDRNNKIVQIIIPEYIQKIRKKKNEVVITVNLPKLNGPQNCLLDVSATTFRLRAEVIGDNDNSNKEEYFLNFELRQKVLADTTKAKWIKKDHSLKVTLPIA